MFSFLKNLGKAIAEHIEGMKRGDRTVAQIAASPIIQGFAQAGEVAARQAALNFVAQKFGVPATQEGAAQAVTAVIGAAPDVDPVAKEILSFYAVSHLLGTAVAQEGQATQQPTVPLEQQQ